MNVDPAPKDATAMTAVSIDEPIFRAAVEAGVRAPSLQTITDLGLTASMLSQPIEVPADREQLRLALGRHGAPQMVLRVGYGQPGYPTPRRSAADVIDRVEG